VLLAPGEVVAGVVDDVIGAEGPDQVHLGRATHAGDRGTEGLGDLDRERPHAARGADDQHLLSWLHLGAVSHALHRGDPGDGNRRSLLEGEVCRLAGKQSDSGTGVLGEGAVTGAVNLVARRELGHVRTDGLDDAGQTPARVGRLGPAETEAHDAHELGQTRHQMPGTPIHAGSPHLYQDLVVADDRPVDLRQSEDLFGCGAVVVLDDRLHRLGVGGRGRRLDRGIER